MTGPERDAQTAAAGLDDVALPERHIDLHRLGEPVARLVDREQLLAGVVGDAVEAHHRVRVGELLVLHLPERGQPVDEELVRGDGAPRAGPDERRLADVVVSAGG